MQSGNLKNKRGKRYTAVFRYEKKDTKKYLEFTKSMRVVQWLILPLYALIVAVFAVRLNHKVKRPLMALKESIVCYQKGQKLSNDNDGPDEFVEIECLKQCVVIFAEAILRICGE